MTAKKNDPYWMEKIHSNGKFVAKAKAAGMSTSAFAAKETKSGSRASKVTKAQATLAQTFAKHRPK